MKEIKANSVFKFGTWAHILPFVVVGIACAGLARPALAQDAVTPAASEAVTAPTPVIPQQVRYAGTLPTRSGDTVEAVFNIYASAEGGEPLWTETQHISVDRDGAYTVLLGSASQAGLPQTLFAGGAARWLGVSVERAPEQTRVLLSSVPYAMKSADAQALAGHPAGDFVTQQQFSLFAQQQQEQHPQTPAMNFQPLTSGTITGSGTAGNIAQFTGANTIGNSVLTQSGTSIGLNTTTPATTLDVNGTSTFRGLLTLPALGTATTSAAQHSQQLQWDASVWSTTAGAAVSPIYKLYEGPVNNNTASPSGDLLFTYQVGTGTPSTILYVTPNGALTSYGGFTDTNASVATASAGLNSPAFEFAGSAYSSTTSSAVAQKFSLEAVATGNDTTTPSANFSLLYGAGSAAPTATGFSIAHNGIVNFATGQTFPGTGSITGITTTSPLTGSGTSGSVALGLNTSTLETTLNSVYPQLSTSNTFTSGASFAGPLSVSASGSGVNAITATATSGATGVYATSDTGNAAQFLSGGAPYSTIYSDNSANYDGSYLPVALNATSTGTESVGLYAGGALAGAFTQSASGIGLWSVSGAASSVPSITNTGVFGVGPDTGILGQATYPGSGDAGVLGYTSTAESSTYTYELNRNGVAGVWGDTTGNPASTTYFSAGVMGTTDAYDGYGGVFISNSEETSALFAKNLNEGNGIYGESLGVGVNSNGDGTAGTGVLGFTPSPAEGNAGVFGFAYQNSNTYYTVESLGPVGMVAGVWGDSGEVNDGTGTYTAGVIGTGDDITAGIFENNSQHPTLSVTNLDTTGGGTGLGIFKTLMASTSDGTCGFGGAGNLTCTGQIKSLATTGDQRKLETYSVQSPENWMEDFGSGLLHMGVAVVNIDPTFAETVSDTAEYHVFLTPKGDSKGLYVINETATSFEVRESGGGTSTLAFDYRIVGKRRGFEAQRLTDVTERFNAERARVMPNPSASVVRKVKPLRPSLTSPGMLVAPGNKAVQHQQPRTNAAPVKVGAARVQHVSQTNLKTK